MDETQERELARGLRSGSTERWYALYDAHARGVWQFVARRMGPRSADVADVVQETFLAAARSAHRYDPERGSLGSWLTGIARNQVAVHYRKRRMHGGARPQAIRCPSRTWSKCSPWLDGGVPPADEVLASAELAATVRATLTELPAHYAELLAAKYFDGNTIEQIADQRTGSAEAVRSRLARARRAFRKAFTRSAPCHEDSRDGGWQ